MNRSTQFKAACSILDVSLSTKRSFRSRRALAGPDTLYCLFFRWATLYYWSQIWAKMYLQYCELARDLHRNKRKQICVLVATVFSHYIKIAIINIPLLIHYRYQYYSHAHITQSGSNSGAHNFEAHWFPGWARSDSASKLWGPGSGKAARNRIGV